MESSEESQTKKSGLKDFLRWYFRVDLKDTSNYIALLIAAVLLWWGLKTMLATFSVGLIP
jgi:hypothetical protein